MFILTSTHIHTHTHTQALVFNVKHCHPLLIQTLLHVEQNILPHVRSLVENNMKTTSRDLDNIISSGKCNFALYSQYI